jgi:uncharacterized protein
MPDIQGKISALYIYPIKSCAAIALESAAIALTGLCGDRQWLIVDEFGQFQTQRQIPHLAWIEPAIFDMGLRLRAPTLQDLWIPFADQSAQRRKITIWQDSLLALDMGDEVGRWLDSFLEIPGKSYRLVQFDAAQTRLSDPAWAGNSRAPVQFADGFALNIISQQSIDLFNHELQSIGHDPIEPIRFRPNMIIDQLQAHEEDNLRRMRILNSAGSIEIELVKPCTRCQIPTINPVTAVHEPEINQILARYRSLARMQDAICFGMNAIVRQTQSDVIQCGDPYEATYDIAY